MLLPILGVVLGLALLTLAADQFVVGATRIAARLRVSTVVIGAVVIGFGTSAPELVVSVLAGLQGSLDLAVGNIVGSNVANLSLVLGVAALISPVTVSSPVLRREAPLSLGLVLLFGLLLQTGTLTLLDGALLFTGLVAALSITLFSARRPGAPGAPVAVDSVQEFLGTGARLSLPRESTRTLLGLLGTLGAAQLLVVSATTVARELGLSEAFIGLTVVAIGTSLPELATAVQAARRDETDLLIGNLLGSNVFNSGAVAAAAAVAGAGQPISGTVSGVGTVLMVGVATLATLFMVSRRTVHRIEALLLLAIYVATLPLLAG
ncbi:MAG: sodium:calcium antiporter [Wenzhouxiangella sp.]|nr:MAG: sodium:calcium antiporter [Nitriliruptor sp.]TVS13719.1 MAG: sodium:calcium antiporter [Wenzhouxiangella sp.]